MKSPVQKNELQPPSDIVFLLESFHQSRLPFHEIVESFERIVEGTHLRIVEVSQEQIEIPFQYADDPFQFFILLMLLGVGLHLGKFLDRLLFCCGEQYRLHLSFDFFVQLRFRMSERDDLSCS